MVSFIRLSPIICLILILINCKSSKKTQTDTTKNSTSSIIFLPPKVEDVPKAPYQPAESFKSDLLHTKLEVSFDWSKQYLFGIATMSFKPYFYNQNELVLDAKGMDIDYVKLVGKKSAQTKDLTYKYDKKNISIQLDKTYSRKDTFTVQVKYTAKPNELPKGGSDAITSDIGLYFINPLGIDPDKPRQIWTQGETESSSCWFPTIDQPNEKTIQEMGKIFINNELWNLDIEPVGANKFHVLKDNTSYTIEVIEYAPP